MKEHIQDGEQILHVARPTRITLAPLIAAVVLLLVATFMLYQATANFAVLVTGFVLTTVAVVILVIRLIVLASFEYVLTDRRVVKQTGILNKKSTDTYLDKINNVDHRQSLWGRILNYGDVEIDTASETGMTSFPSIASPLEFKRKVLEASESYRSGRFTAAPREASGAQKIRDLKALLDDGLITQEEYESKRRQLLGAL